MGCTGIPSPSCCCVIRAACSAGCREPASRSGWQQGDQRRQGVVGLTILSSKSLLARLRYGGGGPEAFDVLEEGIVVVRRRSTEWKGGLLRLKHT